ncbi:MAG: hypothetical protein ACWA47_03785 [Brevirhabdus sp.]
MSISDLTPVETAHVDPDVLAGLHARLGQAGAEAALVSATEQSLNSLAAIRTAFGCGNLEGLELLSGSLGELAAQMGMITYANVARAVADCAKTGDANALAATMARLERISDRSVLSAWGLDDLSG